MSAERFREVRPLRKGPRNQLAAVLGVIALLPAFIPGWLPLLWHVGTVALGILLIVPFTLSVRTTVSSERVEVTIFPFWRWSFAVGELADMEIVASDHLVSLFGGRNTRVSRFGSGTMGPGDRSVGNLSVRFTLSSGTIRQVGSFHPHALVAAVEAEREAHSR